MEDDQREKALASITPTSQQKERMLQNILAHRDQQQTTHSTPDTTTNVIKLKTTNRPWMKNIGLVAACFILLVIGITLTPRDYLHPPVAHLSQPTNNSPRTNPPVAHTPPTDSPMMSEQPPTNHDAPQHMNYNGYRYDVIQTLSGDEVSTTQLSTKLGKLNSQLKGDGGNQDFSTSFAPDGIVWQTSNYNPLFRLIVEKGGLYYLCENVGSTTDTILSLEEYFEAAQLLQLLLEIQVSSRDSGELLSTIEKDSWQELITLLLQSQQIDSPPTISDEATDDLSMELKLSDSTSLDMYITPHNKMMCMGNRYFEISDDLQQYLTQLANM